MSAHHSCLNMRLAFLSAVASLVQLVRPKRFIPLTLSSVPPPSGKVCIMGTISAVVSVHSAAVQTPFPVSRPIVEKAVSKMFVGTRPHPTGKMFRNLRLSPRAMKMVVSRSHPRVVTVVVGSSPPPRIVFFWYRPHAMCGSVGKYGNVGQVALFTQVKVGTFHAVVPGAGNVLPWMSTAKPSIHVVWGREDENKKSKQRGGYKGEGGCARTFLFARAFDRACFSLFLVLCLVEIHIELGFSSRLGSCPKPGKILLRFQRHKLYVVRGL